MHVSAKNVTQLARNLDQSGAKMGPKIDQNWSKIEPSWGQVGVWKGGCTSDIFFTPNLPRLFTEKLTPGANLGPVQTQLGPRINFLGQDGLQKWVSKLFTFWDRFCHRFWTHFAPNLAPKLVPIWGPSGFQEGAEEHQTNLAKTWKKKLLVF